MTIHHGRFPWTRQKAVVSPEFSRLFWGENQRLEFLPTNQLLAPPPSTEPGKTVKSLLQRRRAMVRIFGAEGKMGRSRNQCIQWYVHKHFYCIFMMIWCVYDIYIYKWFNTVHIMSCISILVYNDWGDDMFQTFICQTFSPELFFFKRCSKSLESRRLQLTWLEKFWVLKTQRMGGGEMIIYCILRK